MRISRFMIVTMGSLALSMPALAMAASSTAPTGYYVGMGDGALIVFHALHGGKASIGAVETPTGGDWRPTPATPKAVVAAAQAKHGAWIGTLRKDSPGHYRFVLGSPAHQISYCIHSVIMEADGGLLLQQPAQPKFQTGCTYYHGASWGFSSPLKTPLRAYNVGR